MTSLSSMTDAEKEAYAVELEMKLEKRIAAIAYYDRCVLIEIAATLALNQFQKKYTRAMINRSTLLQEEEDRLIAAKTKAWNDRFAAESEAYPPTLESLLWIVAKSGFTREVAPLMNLSKATRECKNLQRYMREVRTEKKGSFPEIYRGGKTQLYYYCEQGMTASVIRMLEMRSIDVEGKCRGENNEKTCLYSAACNGHLDICRLLIDKGAQVDACIGCDLSPLKIASHHGHLDVCRLLIDSGAHLEAEDYNGTSLHDATEIGHLDVCRLLIDKGAKLESKNCEGGTPLHVSAEQGHIEIARLLCDHGADIEARNINGWRPLHSAAWNGYISVVKELIDDRNAEMNARDIDEKTALRVARDGKKSNIAAYLVHGGVE